MQRDEIGWRVPRPSTKSRQIYDLAKAGKGSAEITKITGDKGSVVRVLLWKIRNPENANQQEYNRLIKQIVSNA